MLGIPAGILLYFIAAQLPRRGVAATSATLLVLGAVLVNLAPENRVYRRRHPHLAPWTFPQLQRSHPACIHAVAAALCLGVSLRAGNSCTHRSSADEGLR